MNYFSWFYKDNTIPGYSQHCERSDAKKHLIKVLFGLKYPDFIDSYNERNRSKYISEHSIMVSIVSVSDL